MSKPVKNKTMVRLAVGTALASLTLAGCSAKVAPPASASAAAAETALAKGKSSQAVEFAEAAVLAAPRDAAGRALLGAAYVEAGRFVSAATTLGEAIELGDTSRRTIITYALAQIAAGNPNEALVTLDRFEAALDPADFGLAVALAGRPQQGVHVLANALRDGRNTAKVRQNLAYAYALTGDWQSARLMAAQDVPADQVGERLGHWAQMALPEMFQHRVADLLGTGIATDPGQPTQLALANHPSHAMMVAEAAAVAPVEETIAVAPSEELPAVAQATPVAFPAFPEGPVAPTAEETERTNGPAAVRFVAREMVQGLPGAQAGPVRQNVVPRIAGQAAAQATTAAPVPQANASRVAKAEAPTPRQRAGKSFVMKPGDYRVQLGSYFSMSDAQAAWKLFMKRHPELEGAQKVISKANVKGKIYYRVAAGGFARQSAKDMCGLVSKGGGGCLAYAANNPLPGTIDNDVRVARR
ncbi:hypothetical protein MTsN3n11_07380 [Qipengyuania sp. MTN3-11]